MWREKHVGMIDATLDSSARKPQRELFKKAAKVCSMLQSSNSNSDIDSVGVDKTWALCKSMQFGILYSFMTFLVTRAIRQSGLYTHHDGQRYASDE